MNIALIRAACGALLISLLLVACGDDDTDAQSLAAKSAAAGEGSPLLAYIPDDTPYFMANQERLTDEILDLIWDMGEPALKYFDRLIQKQLDEGTGDALQRAILEELSGKMNRAGMAELGLAVQGNIAVYGIGVLPVMRMDVADSDRIYAAIQRVEQKADTTFPRQELGGIEYFEAGDDDATVIVSVGDNQVLLSVMPTKAKALALERVLGVRKPELSLASSGRLQSLNKEFELSPYGTLLLDTERLVQAVISDQTDLAQVMFAEQQGQLSEVCRAEFQDMARVMPRVVSGYRDINDREIDQLAVFELRSDLAQGMQALAQPVAGMGREEDGMFYFGLALNVLKAKQFLQARADAIAQEPYRCEHLAELNRGMQEMRGQLATPLPPMVGNVQGIRVNLKNVDMSMGMPSDLRMLAMVGMSSPQLVIGMAGAFVPQLASLQLGNDGNPVPLPADALPFPLDSPHVAMMDHGLAFSVGTGEEANLKAYLDAEAPNQAPFMSLGYDMRAMQIYQEQMMKTLAAIEDGGGSVEVPGISDKLDRVSAQVAFTARGVEMESTTYLKP